MRQSANGWVDAPNRNPIDANRPLMTSRVATRCTGLAPNEQLSNHCLNARPSVAMLSAERGTSDA